LQPQARGRWTNDYLVDFHEWSGRFVPLTAGLGDIPSDLPMKGSKGLMTRCSASDL
jgi:hypothetical protein